MLLNNNSGFSIPELLITLAISSIIIGAAFGSYLIVSHNYRVQKDIQYMSDLARPAVNMIVKDVRMAGYRDDSSAAILNPITINNSGSACCDSIEIVYDVGEGTSTKRRLIKYFTAATSHNANDVRRRLWKQIRQCTNSECTTFAATDLMPPSPIADYVEDLQFVGSNADCTQGDKRYGCGTDGWLTPTSITASDPWGVGSHINPGYANDNNPRTVFKCSTPSGSNCNLVFQFTEYFRLKKFKFHVAAGINGGDIGSYDFNTDIGSLSWPYAAASGNTTSIQQPLPYYPLTQRLSIMVNGNNCSWSTSCNPINRPGLTNAGPENISEIFLLGAPECDYNYNNDQDNSCERTLDTAPQPLPPGTLANNPIQQSIINRIIVNIDDSNSKCGAYSAAHQGHSIPQLLFVANCGFGAIPEIKFYGEIFGGEITSREIKVGLILKSPSEHGSLNRAGSKSLGDRNVTWNDRYLRDFYSTSVVPRNMYYQSL